jgi:hypothetical protein
MTGSNPIYVSTPPLIRWVDTAPLEAIARAAVQQALGRPLAYLPMPPGVRMGEIVCTVPVLDLREYGL